MPTDIPLNSPDFEQTWHDLREGLETSRKIVEQSRVLIELSESDPPFPAENDNDGMPN